MEIHMLTTIILCVLIPAMGIYAGHWFPWRKVAGRDLTRIEAYIYGTAWVVGVPLIFMSIWQEWLAVGVIVAAVGGAGFATVSAYAIDGWAEQKHRLLDEKDKAQYANYRTRANEAD